MRRRTTLRRYGVGRLVRLGVVASYNALASCAPAAHYSPPTTLGGYEVLVTARDSLGEALARGLADRGFTVRRRVRGGGPPTAYLFTFTFRETDPPQVRWLHVRLADTRTGAIVAAVSAPLDSLGATTLERARAIVDSLAGKASLREPPGPT